MLCFLIKAASYRWSMSHCHGWSCISMVEWRKQIWLEICGFEIDDWFVSVGLIFSRNSIIRIKRLALDCKVARIVGESPDPRDGGAEKNSQLIIAPFYSVKDIKDSDWWFFLLFYCNTYIRVLLHAYGYFYTFWYCLLTRRWYEISMRDHTISTTWDKCGYQRFHFRPSKAASMIYSRLII